MKLNNNKKNMKAITLLVFIALLLSILMIANASAIGITPGTATINFESGLQKQGEFTIINSEHKVFNAFIFVQGDLKDSIILSKNIVEFNEATNSLSFSYSIRLPSSIEKPGEHIAKIVVMEMPSDSNLENMEGSAIIATAAVAHQVKIKVPYPGKYAEMEMHIQEAMVNEVTSFIFPVSNLGQEDIQKAKVKIQILGPTNEKIAEIESNEESIKSSERKEIVVQWRANVNAGFYHAVATLEYDDRLARAEKTFSVGNLMIELNRVSVKDFNLGAVAKFDIEVASKWNGDINDLYAQVQILNEKGDIIADFKSASTSLKPLEKTIINAYWDTAGVNIGNYNARVILNYNGKTTEKMLNTYVDMKSIKMEFAGIAGKVTEEESQQKKTKTTNLFIFLLIGVLIAINIAWFVFFRKRMKKTN